MQIVSIRGPRGGLTYAATTRAEFQRAKVGRHVPTLRGHGNGDRMAALDYRSYGVPFLPCTRSFARDRMCDNRKRKREAVQ